MSLLGRVYMFIHYNYKAILETNISITVIAEKFQMGVLRVNGFTIKISP